MSQFEQPSGTFTASGLPWWDERECSAQTDLDYQLLMKLEEAEALANDGQPLPASVQPSHTVDRALDYPPVVLD